MMQSSPQKVPMPVIPQPEEESKTKPKSKKGGKKTKRKNLSSREDVMNKNTFRAIKRQLKMMYYDYLNTDEYKNSHVEEREIDSFIEKVDTFTRYLLRNTAYDTSKSINRRRFTTYCAIMIDYCKMKKMIADDDTPLLTETFNVIYSYSHQKFYEYLSKEEIKIVFAAIFQRTTIQEFIEKHDTLKIT